ncbi:TetR family transcriptional regulator [Polymorphospora sp. NPDC051019]|uniref:TetR/AcrR family transcriptional regulator n=1 Tax=Polymorphospora sp. NPDC051019 TaxID=3155725 RepID=UPI003431AD71
MEAAIETLAEVGYAKTSLTRIAARAGISQGLISYHFSSKQDLMEQVVTEVNADMERFVEARAGDADDHAGTVKALIEGFVRYCADRPAGILAVGQIENAEGWAAEARERSIADVEQLLRGGQEAGEFRSFPTRLMAVTLLAALEAVPGELRAKPETDPGVYAAELAMTFELAVHRTGR